MDIKFNGKYKSLTDFQWHDIPSFVIITGPNGTGKSQLLDLIYKSTIKQLGTNSSLEITGTVINPSEVTFLKGEWHLQNTTSTNMASLQTKLNEHLDKFKKDSHRYMSSDIFNEKELRLFTVYKGILKKTGKVSPHEVTIEEFTKNFPETLIEQDNQISQKISEIFYNYRLSEIELILKGKKEEEIISQLGEKPWKVLREIIKEAKLPFDINDPSECTFKDSFQLKLTHQILKEEVIFNDLSSGEKVLISIAFYFYNSQEKKIFPKLLLMDEPDAHLHPSMSQQFLNVVKNVLVDKYSVQVIMTTHSPSTVVLAPSDSVYEMSREEPRIKKSISKNNAVLSLTAGLVYVGTGTKYFLVEDEEDSEFYSYVYKQLINDQQISANVPLVFIPASLKDNSQKKVKSGGKSVVQSWIKKLTDSGLTSIIHGLIDADDGNIVSAGVFKIERYSIENYLIDPILVYAALMDKEKHPQIDGLKLSVGEEYKLKLLTPEILQKIVDIILLKVNDNLKTCFSDFNSFKETETVEVFFTPTIKLSYPKWLFTRPGKM
jgi:ABC-type ATPase involved in cell division